MTDAQWTEDRLQTFLGREESIRLECKSGRLLDRSPEKAAEDLSKAVSAFANTEGGFLIIGIAEEERGKLRVASRIDGVLATDWPTHRLQQLIESNVHPPLMGLRIHRVQLPQLNDRVAFVIEVPPGRTAHQAKDCRYYGRSELETKPLRDFDIRLRMERGKALHATIAVSVRRGRSAKDLRENQIEEYRKQLHGLREDLLEQGIDLASPGVGNKSPLVRAARDLGADRPHLIETEHLSSRYRCNEYEVEFALTNSGERTIRDFEVQILTSVAAGCGVTDNVNAQPSGGFWSQEDISKYEKLEIRTTLKDCLRTGKRKVWSGSTIVVGRVFMLVPELKEASSGVATATWTIFLDDALPISGECNLGVQIATAEAM